MFSRISMLDLEDHYAPLQEKMLEAIQKIFKSKQFILGEEVKSLEEEIGQFVGCQHALGMTSGTDALLVALMALKVGHGDEVITTPFSFFATAGVIARLGAKPVFVDIRDDDFNIDVNKIANAITAKTKAILPVHLYGQCADIRALKCLNKNIPIVEDAAQAIGSTHHGKFAGALGNIGCFSFYPTKNLGGVAEGGMCTTNSKNLNKTLSLLRSHGSGGGYYHEIVGGNFRLGAINGAILRINLKHLSKWTENRQKNANLYSTYFQNTNLVKKEKITLPFIHPYNKHTFHQYVIRTPKRKELQEYLKSKEIFTAIYYPIPLHLQPCLKEFGYKEGDFPVAEQCSKDVLALPVYPELSSTQIERVCQEIENFWKEN